MGEQAILGKGEAVDVGFVLQPGDVGVAAQRAGTGAGGIEQDGVELLIGRPLARVGSDQFGRQAGARQILAQPLHAPGRDIDRSDRCTGGDELQGLAAGRRAKIGDPLAHDIAQQAGRQRGGGVLHPPGTFGKARQLGDHAADRAAYRASGQQLAFQATGP